MSDTDIERRLDALVAALSDDHHEGAGTADTGRHERYEIDVKGKTMEQCFTEPYSGIRYRDPNVGTTALDSLLDRFTPLHHLDKLRESLITISTVAIIGRRTAATSSKGTEYIKWQLTDLKQCNVQCFVFGEAAGQLSQIRPGTVVALLKATYDSSQHGCLKVNDNKQMKAVGVSVDFAYCAGHNRKGERCQNVVNKSTCPFCDHHLQQGRKKLVMGARPECQGTVLGAVHGAQMKNPECLTKLSQRTPKRKRPQSLDQMNKCAGQASSHRAGSMGAKLISRFVQQQHQAARSAKLDQQEAALYCSPDTDLGHVPMLPSVPSAQVSESSAADPQCHPKSSRKLIPGTNLGGASKVLRLSRQISNIRSATSDQPRVASQGQDTDGRGTSSHQGGTHTQAGYVSALLEEIAAECQNGQAPQDENSIPVEKRQTHASHGGCNGVGLHRGAAAGVGPARQAQKFHVVRYAPATSGATTSNSKRPMSTERRVRRVLKDVHQARTR